MTNRGLIRYLRFHILGETVHPRASRRKPRKGPARNWKYKAWIRSLPSAVSGQTPCEAAHTGNDGGMKQKASDYSCIPLTQAEHAQYHTLGKYAFEKLYHLDYTRLVARLNHAWFEYSGLVK